MRRAAGRGPGGGGTARRENRLPSAPMLDNPAVQQTIFAFGSKLVGQAAAILIKRTTPPPPADRMQALAPSGTPPPPQLRPNQGGKPLPRPGSRPVSLTRPPAISGSPAGNSPTVPSTGQAPPPRVDPKALEAWYEECRTQSLPYPEAAARLKAVLRGEKPEARG